jgi:hypothetical protein
MHGFRATIKYRMKLHSVADNCIIIIMLPNQAIASTPSAPRPSGAEGRGSTAPLRLQLLRTSQISLLHKILSNTPRNHPAPPPTTPNIDNCMVVLFVGALFCRQVHKHRSSHHARWWHSIFYSCFRDARGTSPPSSGNQSHSSAVTATLRPGHKGKQTMLHLHPHTPGSSHCLPCILQALDTCNACAVLEQGDHHKVQPQLWTTACWPQEYKACSNFGTIMHQRWSTLHRKQRE